MIFQDQYSVWTHHHPTIYIQSIPSYINDKVRAPASPFILLSEGPLHQTKSKFMSSPPVKRSQTTALEVRLASHWATNVLLVVTCSRKTYQISTIKTWLHLEFPGAIQCNTARFFLILKCQTISNKIRPFSIPPSPLIPEIQCCLHFTFLEQCYIILSLNAILVPKNRTNCPRKLSHHSRRRPST